MVLIEKYKKVPVSVKASLWYVISSILQRGIAFITTPIFTRLMTTEQYGQVTIYNSWLEIFTIFATLNLFYGVFNNALTKYPEDKETVISSMQGLCSTLTFGMFVIYILFSKWINELTGMSTFMTCVLFIEVLFVPAYQFWAAKERFDYKYKKLIFFSLLISVLMPILGIPAVLLSTEKGYSKILSSVFAQLIVAIFLYIFIFYRGKTFYSKKYWKYALAFNLPLIPHYLSSTVLNQSDRIMIDKMCGTDKAGIYGLAYTLGALVFVVNQAVMNSYTPWTYKKLKAGCFDDVRKNSTFLALLIAVLALILVTFAPEIMWILGGENYQEGKWIIAPIAASVFFRFLYSLYGNVEFYYEENYFIMIASVLCALLNILLNYVFISLYGYLAAGYTTLVCFALYSFAHFIFSQRVIHKHTNQKNIYNNKSIFAISLCVVILCLSMMLLYNLLIIRYAIILVMLMMVLIFREKIIRFARTILENKK